ncbi:hypothetical protein BU16DRAFT_306271 [Lophium mytilinum]|uniref:Uncharacterized protein n=1 Tax=Lophium mytilinum TaxID=390894 RepID=A0A6A6R2A3_9PEZI|nr:hypothetical protein BU16DRAFT_306271 [Lophium mytilinum]
MRGFEGSSICHSFLGRFSLTTEFQGSTPTRDSTREQQVDVHHHLRSSISSLIESRLPWRPVKNLSWDAGFMKGPWFWELKPLQRWSYHPAERESPPGPNHVQELVHLRTSSLSLGHRSCCRREPVTSQPLQAHRLRSALILEGHRTFLKPM